MIRERVASALTSSDLAPSAERDRPVDLVGAMGGMSRLASLLYRLKYCDELGPTQKRTAAYLLARDLRPRGRSRRRPHVLLTSVAWCALEEWLLDRCTACNGRGELGGRADVVLTITRRCRPCAGTGSLARYSLRSGCLFTWTCGTCRGAGIVRISRRVTAEPTLRCMVCHGTGRFVPTDVDRARRLGTTPEQASKWRARIERAMDYLRRLDVDGARALYRRLE